MTLSYPQEASHHRARTATTAARIGQFTGALLIAGGVATLRLGHLAGAWAGLTGLVMVSTFQAHSGGVLAIAAPETARGRDSPGCPWAGRRPRS